MTIVFVAIFFVTLGLALYGFIGYPLVMWVVAKLRGGESVVRDTSTGGDVWPSATVIVAAYNEQDSLASTLEALLKQDYPGTFTVEVFSDGSTDATDAIARGFSERGVTLTRFEGRLGKTECQNRMVERATAEIVAFADGNVTWHPEALRQLVSPLRDTATAATTGALRLVRAGQSEQRNEGLFRRLDNIIKVGESAIHSTVGVNGPIYAVRRSDYIKLQAHLVSDLVLPVLLVAKGKHVRYVPTAIADEPTTPSVWHEFRRKRRLVTQGYAALPLLLRAAHPVQRPMLFFLLVSHKLLRWVGVELLLVTFVATVALLYIPLFQTILIGELTLLAMAALSLVVKHRSRALDALGFFVLTNAASLLGAFDYLRGETATRWKTERA